MKASILAWLRRFSPVIAVIAVILAIVAATMPIWLPSVQNSTPAPRPAATAPAKVTPKPTTPKATTPAEPLVAFGSKGTAVATLQTRLNAWNVQPQLVATSTFDAATLAAVKAYQTAEGLKADGVVGVHTWAALEASPPANPAPVSYTIPKAPVPTPSVATPADLSIGVQAAPGGNSAGASWYDLTFTNTAKVPVTMNGFPVVAVGANGIQVGAGAAEVTGVTPTLVTVKPGGVAYALLKVTDVGALVPQYAQAKTSQLLVEIPGSTTQVIVPLTITSATNGASFLTVYPISSNAGA